MTLLGFRHAEENAAAFFVWFVGREVAVDESGFPFGAPVGLQGRDHFGVFQLHSAGALLAVFTPLVQLRSQGRE
jgi:hypothetical protein